jgi:hypothetical protein
VTIPVLACEAAAACDATEGPLLPGVAVTERWNIRADVPVRDRCDRPAGVSQPPHLLPTVGRSGFENTTQSSLLSPRGPLLQAMFWEGVMKPQSDPVAISPPGDVATLSGSASDSLSRVISWAASAVLERSAARSRLSWRIEGSAAAVLPPLMSSAPS